ncbi:hypothetical protein OK351_16820 [Glutamicibacter sp. MNS18]|uniref:hypothetical protein n=1 Tax=Glutamicibacter sp. MNS18 TaxID=2989817 RepID=UPI002235D0E8|nr:hypothetical protein [Glutamicibacter sp. MNS18]MCW4467147.1 hypothetical protein [Glutamicibacter sp. MNS18]
MNESPLPIIADTTGLSRGYRFLWRMKFTALMIFGPAERTIHSSPRERLKWERAMKVLRAHEASGTRADEQTVQTAARMESR